LRIAVLKAYFKDKAALFFEESEFSRDFKTGWEGLTGIVSEKVEPSF
jgi:hypothetical protein